MRSPESHLLNRRWLIPITNLCNKACGGCAQLCGHFPPDKIWILPLAEIDRTIRLLKPFTGPHKNYNELTIFGGEPTLHPQWEEVRRLVHSHAPFQFRVNTNGRLGHTPFQREQNITYYVDPHPDDQLFHTTMVAAQDVLTLTTPEAYWEKAQKDCLIWDREGAMVYNGKAYYCEHAAAMDWLFYGGANGWPLVEGVNPFDRTAAEIEAQARLFCHRCGWCVPELTRQRVGDKMHVSPTNSAYFKREELVQLIVPNRNL